MIAEEQKRHRRSAEVEWMNRMIGVKQAEPRVGGGGAAGVGRCGTAVAVAVTAGGGGGPLPLLNCPRHSRCIGTEF